MNSDNTLHQNNNNEKVAGTITDIFEKLKDGLFLDNQIISSFSEDGKVKLSIDQADLDKIIEQMKESAFKVIDHKIEKKFLAEIKKNDLMYNNEVNKLLAQVHDLFSNFQSDFLTASSNFRIQLVKNTENIKEQIDQLQMCKINPELQQILEESLKENMYNSLNEHISMYELIVKNIIDRFHNLVQKELQ